MKKNSEANARKQAAPHKAPHKTSHKETRTWLTYGIGFTLLWLLLTQGEVDSWIIGIFVVPLAVWCAIRLFPDQYSWANQCQQTLKISALPRFIPFFLIQSLRGGWESALFAIHPSKRLHCDFIYYPTRLPEGGARLFYLNTISLLPGTVSAQLRDDVITIHVLNSRADHHQALQACEKQIATLFGLTLMRGEHT